MTKTKNKASLLLKDFFYFFWGWIKRNFGNIFSVLGVFLTIYFSVFYVPGYIRELKQQKIEKVNQSLIETVQELAYSKQPLSIDILNTLIKGKEIKHEIVYPYSVAELLIQVQENFMDNNFIPLKERSDLVASIDTLRLAIKGSNEKVLPKQERIKEKWDLLSILLGMAGTIFSILGFYSIYFKQRKEEELREERDSAILSSRARVDEEFQFLNLVERILEKLNVDVIIPKSPADERYDFEVNTQKGKFIIECKIKLSIEGIHMALYSSIKFGGTTIVVLKIPPPKEVINRIDLHNAINNDRQIYLVWGDSEEQLLRELEHLLI